jgi:hypothetical protein
MPEILAPGDTLVVWRLDRLIGLARSLGNLIQLTNERTSIPPHRFGIFNREAGYRFADRKACFDVFGTWPSSNVISSAEGLYLRS